MKHIWAHPVFPNLGDFHCGAPEVGIVGVLFQSHKMRNLQ
jgi:hypothetical protein